AGYLHGYILLGVVRSDVPPPKPPAGAITSFERRWKPDFFEKLRDTLRTTSSSTTGAARMVTQLREDAKVQADQGSNIAKDILKVKETFLIKLYGLVLTAGLDAWRPDIMGPPDSLYNQAHEIVYFESFRLLAGSFAYVFLAPTASGVNNATLIQDIGRAFLFSYMKHKAQVDRKEPGKLADNREDNNISRRRKRV
ncbi:hypothetical protein K438DRAFT_1458087, partial [Mycena galopus ATCC 62051]